MSSRLLTDQLKKIFLDYDIAYKSSDLDQVKLFQYRPSSDERSQRDAIFITVGNKALQTAWKQLENKKIFSLLVSQEKIRKIIATYSHSNKLHGIYLEQSLKRQILLAQQLLPGIRSIGFLTTLDNKERLHSQLQYFQSKASFEIQTVSDQKSLGKALSSIIQNSELLITLAEPEIYNRSSLRNILLSAYRNNIPLLGLNKAFVDAGCLAAVYTTTEQIVEETVKIINNAKEGEALPKIDHAKKYELSLNHKVSKSLGLYIPSKKEILIRMTENE